MGLKHKHLHSLKYLTIGILLAIVVMASYVVFTNTPNDIGDYDHRMQEFVELEAKALEVFGLPENTPKDQLCSKIASGLQYWNESIALITELDQLDLPDEIHLRNKKLLQYCDIRVKSYHNIYKAIDENTDKYRPQIDEYNREIEKVIKELSGGDNE